MKKLETFCPVRDILTYIGNKWPVLVLFNLNGRGTMRFSELAHEIPDISQKKLSTTLQMLERMNLIDRRAYPEVPPRVEYTLTSLGHSLMPHLQALIDWILSHREACMQKNSRS